LPVGSVVPIIAFPLLGTIERAQGRYKPAT
jgi:hypothetical protein